MEQEERELTEAVGGIRAIPRAGLKSGAWRRRVLAWKRPVSTGRAEQEWQASAVLPGREEVSSTSEHEWGAFEELPGREEASPKALSEERRT